MNISMNTFTSKQNESIKSSDVLRTTGAILSPSDVLQQGELSLPGTVTASSLVLDALSGAGLSETQRNLTLLETMLSNEMSVDKQSVMKMLHLMNAHPDASIDALCLLSGADIEVTDSSIADAEAFLNVQTSLTDIISDIADYIDETVTMTGYDSAPVNSESASLSSADPVMEQQPTAKAMPPVQSEGVTIPQDVTESLSGSADFPVDTTTSTVYQPSVESSSPVMSAITDTTASPDNSPVQTPEPTGSVPAQVNAESQIITESPVTAPKTGRDTIHAEVPEAPVSSVSSEASTVRESSVSSEASAISQVPAPSEGSEPLEAAPSPVKGYSATLSDRIDEPASPRAEAEPSALKEAVLPKTPGKPVRPVLKPREISSESIRKFLVDTYEYLRSVENHALSTGDRELMSKAQKAMESMKTLTDYNNIYAYAEVPVTMRDEQPAGKLSIYADKRRKRTSTQDSTAYLRLNMPSLGQVDVKLCMNGRKLKVDFYSGDESRKLLEDNSQSLINALKDKSLDSSVQFSGLPDINSSKGDEEHPSVSPSEIQISLINSGKELKGFDTLA